MSCFQCFRSPVEISQNLFTGAQANGNIALSSGCPGHDAVGTLLMARVRWKLSSLPSSPLT